LRLAALLIPLTLLAQFASTDFLHWGEKEVKARAFSTRVSGRVGSLMGFRGLHTDRSFSYKLRATWMTPDVIRACSRIEQMTKHLADVETLKVVSEAEAVGDTVVMVELDPDEGSGIIPSSWSAVLGPVAAGGRPAQVIRGVNTPSLDSLRGLAGPTRRDYNYDIFWLVFALKTEAGEPLFQVDDKEAALTVRVNDMSGTVKWSIPDSIRMRVVR